MYNQHLNHEGCYQQPCGPHIPMEHPPIIKCPIEKVCSKDIHHHVKHIQPIHTRIINRHIYNHCCVPYFTCSEEHIQCHNWR